MLSSVEHMHKSTKNHEASSPWEVQQTMLTHSTNHGNSIQQGTTVAIQAEILDRRRNLRMKWQYGAASILAYKEFSSGTWQAYWHMQHSVQAPSACSAGWWPVAGTD
jgi:hypothetical protein